MKTGIVDINGVEICVGDKVRKINGIDDSAIWEVRFGEFTAVINNTWQTIHVVFLADTEEDYEEVMETETYWQYSKADKTKYEIVNEEEIL